MKRWFLGILGCFLINVSLFAMEIILPSGFPYRGIVYQHLRMTREDRGGIQVISNTPIYYAFRWRDRTYRARLFIFGAIYLEKEGEMPWLLTFDVRQFRSDGYFPFPPMWP